MAVASNRRPAMSSTDRILAACRYEEIPAILVLNKIDLPAAEPDRVRQQIEDVIGLDASDAVEISAKTGIGIDEVLEAVVKRLPAPKGDVKAPLKAMLVDSWYDAYLGVVVLVRVIDGILKKGQKVKLMSTGAVHLIDRVGIFRPKQDLIGALHPGEIGFFTAAIKQVASGRFGVTTEYLVNSDMIQIKMDGSFASFVLGKLFI